MSVLLVPFSPNEAIPEIAPIDDIDAEYGQQPVNNINVMGTPEKGASTATPQNQVMMNARPDWLGGLAEGLLGSTYTGMSRPKYFGTGTGKINNLFNIESGPAGAVVSSASGVTANATGAKLLKIRVSGTSYYVLAATSWS